VKILKSALRMGFLLAKNNPLPEKKYRSNMSYGNPYKNKNGFI
jgi:hypothetical protein